MLVLEARNHQKSLMGLRMPNLSEFEGNPFGHAVIWKILLAIGSKQIEPRQRCSTLGKTMTFLGLVSIPPSSIA